MGGYAGEEGVELRGEGCEKVGLCGMDGGLGEEFEML